MAALPKVLANVSNRFWATATGLRLCIDISLSFEVVVASGRGIAADDPENANATIERNVEARMTACR